MKKVIKRLNIVIVIIALVIVILLLKKPEIIINGVSNLRGLQESEENLEEPFFSYIMYDNQNDENIKVLVEINSDTGIEYVICPNGNKIIGNGNKKVAIDYEISKNTDNQFTIKEKEEDEKNENVFINEEFISDKAISIDVLADIDGYLLYQVNSKIDELLNSEYSIYYKVGENGTWSSKIDDGSKYTLLDYNLNQQNLVNKDDTITITAKAVNNSNNTTVIKEIRIPINTTAKNESLFEQESLLKSIENNELESGKYTIEVSEQIYNVKLYNIIGDLNVTQNLAFGLPIDVGTATTYAQNMVVVKVNGDLIIDNEGILTSYNTAYGGTKGLLIYCTGTITNNGTISMTARGAKAVGQNVYMWKNSDNSYEYVPASGGAGGASVSPSGAHKQGNNGTNGTNRSTGGGGSGAVTYHPTVSGARTCASGAGSIGTSYSGGTGGSGSRRISGNNIGGNGQENGGAGGAAPNCGGSGGGAGNPGGQILVQSEGGTGENGTGGLLIIYGNNIINNNSIQSNGSLGGRNWAGGGSSGGGSINIFYSNEYTNTGDIIANGGARNGSWANGGAGGTGSISVGTILTGTYESVYKNY